MTHLTYALGLFAELPQKAVDLFHQASLFGFSLALVCLMLVGCNNHTALVKQAADPGGSHRVLSWVDAGQKKDVAHVEMNFTSSGLVQIVFWKEEKTDLGAAVVKTEVYLHGTYTVGATTEGKGDIDITLPSGAVRKGLIKMDSAGAMDIILSKEDGERPANLNSGQENVMYISTQRLPNRNRWISVEP